MTRRRVSFEWALIADVNDRFSTPRNWRDRPPMRAHVNLIPLNATHRLSHPGLVAEPGHAVPRDDSKPAGSTRRSGCRDPDIDAVVTRRAGHEAKVVVGAAAGRRTRTVMRSVRIASTRRSWALTRARTTRRSAPPTPAPPHLGDDRRPPT